MRALLFCIISVVLLQAAISNAQNLTIPKFSQVTAEIYRGGRPTSVDLSQLQKQYKISTLIDLENDNSVNAQERQWTQNIGMSFLLTAINPFTTPTDKEVDGVLAQLQDSHNFPIFIHCHHGEDRTGLILGLYRVLVQGWPAVQAYREMLDNGFHPALTGLDNYFRQRTGYNGQ